MCLTLLDEGYTSFVSHGAGGVYTLVGMITVTQSTYIVTKVMAK